MALKHRQNDKLRLFGSTAYQLPWTEYLKCCVCEKDFNRRAKIPVSLGCGHTYCRLCLHELKASACMLCKTKISYDVLSLPPNSAILKLLPEDTTGTKESDEMQISGYYLNHQLAVQIRPLLQTLNELAMFLKPDPAGTDLSRSMQRKLILVLNNQLVEELGRQRTLRCCKAAAERVMTELILYHQSPTTLSSSLWDAVRARGCQFLGPAMQEEALKLIQFALGDQSELSRKVLVQLVVQKLQPQFPQASKTSIGHVVQLLYRASCFIVTKRDKDSSLMRLKDEFLQYEDLRKEHDAQIVQIAREAGLRISPDQWTALLYGDQSHKSHMQSIIDRLQSCMTFEDAIKDLTVVLDRSGDPGSIKHVILHFNRIAQIDPVNTTSNLEILEQCLCSLHVVLKALVYVLKNHQVWLSQAKEATQQCSKYKTSMCRDSLLKGVCPRGEACTFAHSDEELQRYRNKRRRRGISSANTVGSSGALKSNKGIELLEEREPQILSCMSNNNNSPNSASALSERCHHCNSMQSPLNPVKSVAVEEKCGHYSSVQPQHREYQNHMPDPVSNMTQQKPPIMSPMVQTQPIMDKSYFEPPPNHMQPGKQAAIFKQPAPQSVYSQNLQPTVMQVPAPSSFTNTMQPHPHHPHNMNCCHIQPPPPPLPPLSVEAQPPQAYTMQPPPPIAYMPLTPPLIAAQQRPPDMYMAQPNYTAHGHHPHNVYLLNPPQQFNEPAMSYQKPPQQVLHHPADKVIHRVLPSQPSSSDTVLSKFGKGETLDELRKRKNEVINKLVQKQIVQPKACCNKDPAEYLSVLPAACSSYWPTIPTSKSGEAKSSSSKLDVTISDKENTEFIWSKNFQTFAQERTEEVLSKNSKKSCDVPSGSYDNQHYNLWASQPGELFNTTTSSINVTSDIEATTVLEGSEKKCICNNCHAAPTSKLSTHDLLPSADDELVPFPNVRIVSKYGPIARTVRSNTTPAIPEQVQANGNAFTQPMASDDKRCESNFYTNKSAEAKQLRVCTDVEPTSTERHPNRHKLILAPPNMPFLLVPRDADTEMSCDKQLLLKNEEEDLLLAMELQQIEIDIQSKLKAQ